jgi:serine/threonine protein kinase/formylglycine-generating enzyme required for sulfatase activity
METVAFEPTADFHSTGNEGCLDVAIPVQGFEILDEVGKGGMGTVFKARQHSLDRFVAVKVLHPILAIDRGMVERFRREAILGAGLRHPHLMQVHEIQESYGTPVIVMPLIDGKDLGKIARDRREHKKGTPFEHPPHPWVSLPDKEYLAHLLPVLDQMIDGVAALHKAGILHRDIKPGNVLIDERGEAIVADFGLAQLQDHEQTLRPGSGPGTPSYRAPEQAQGDRQVDARADIFSVGVSLYQALTLELPYGRTGCNADSPTPQKPSRLQASLPSRDFDDVIAKAIEPNPEKRYQSIGELQEDWKLVRQGGPPRYARRVSRPEQIWRAIKRRPAVVVACLTSAAFLIALGLLLLPWRRPITRTIQIETEPPSARLAIVPLDPESGYPDSEQAIRPRGRSPATVPKVPVGEYMVLALLDNGDFHEVYRKVPEPGEQPDALDEPLWEAEKAGPVKLKKIRIPSTKTVLSNMAYRKGGAFTMGSMKIPSEAASMPHHHIVGAFYLDVTEVTFGAYKAFAKRLSPELESLHLHDKDAVRAVTWLGAMMYAESVGARLPWEDEWEFAATNGGNNRFPWGDYIDPAQMKSWSFGPAGTPAWDATRTEPKIYGLYSNVGEWTMSRFHEYPGVDQEVHDVFAADPVFQAKIKQSRIVRGAPNEVLRGHSLTAAELAALDPRLGARERVGWNSYSRLAGLGFRCARSAGPRYLDTGSPHR